MANLKKKRILLIEDHQNIIVVEKMCLEANGFEVLVAEDGLQGLELARREEPDLILLDILIPKLNGYLVLEALQKNDFLSKIPVLVTSAKAQIDDLKQAYCYPIQGYLIKPFTSQELLSKIQEILLKGDVKE